MERKRIIRTCIVFWVSFFFLGILPAHSGEASDKPGQAVVTINFRSSCKVDADDIRVGDVAKVLCADSEIVRKIENIIIGTSPEPGESKIIDADSIAASLQRVLPPLGIPLDMVQGRLPTEMTVQRIKDGKTQRVFSKIYRDYIFQHMPWKKDNVVISDIKVGKTSFIPGENGISCKIKANPRLTYAGNTPLCVVFSRDQKRVGSVNIIGNVQIFKPIARTTHYLKSHHIISKEDIQFVKENITNLPPDVILSSKAVVDKEVVRSFKANEIIRKCDIKEPVVVQKGDMVTLLIDTPALRITSKGRALEGGRVGQVMRIRNIATEKIILGQVKDEHTVVVTF